MAMLERVIGGLVGGAFALRAFDERKAWWARIAYGAVGADLLISAYNGTPFLGVSAATEAVEGQDAIAGTGTSARAKLTKIGKSAGKFAKSKPADTAFQLKTKLPKFEERRVKTIEERVAYVHEQAVKGTRDPKIYTLAREVLSRKHKGEWLVDEKDYRGEATALFNEIKKRVRYTWDPLDYDAFQTPAKTLELQTGDCDDYTSLLAACLRTVGIEVRTRIVETTGAGTWSHIYLMAKVQDGWMSLDLSVKEPAGWEVPDAMVVRKKDFMIVEEGLDKVKTLERTK